MSAGERTAAVVAVAAAAVAVLLAAGLQLERHLLKRRLVVLDGQELAEAAAGGDRR